MAFVCVGLTRTLSSQDSRPAWRQHLSLNQYLDSTREISQIYSPTRLGLKYNSFKSPLFASEPRKSIREILCIGPPLSSHWSTRQQHVFQHLSHQRKPTLHPLKEIKKNLSMSNICTHTYPLEQASAERKDQHLESHERVGFSFSLGAAHRAVLRYCFTNIRPYPSEFGPLFAGRRIGRLRCFRLVRC